MKTAAALLLSASTAWLPSAALGGEHPAFANPVSSSRSAQIASGYGRSSVLVRERGAARGRSEQRDSPRHSSEGSHHSSGDHRHGNDSGYRSHGSHGSYSDHRSHSSYRTYSSHGSYRSWSGTGFALGFGLGHTLGSAFYGRSVYRPQRYYSHSFYSSPYNYDRSYYAPYYAPVPVQRDLVYYCDDPAAGFIDTDIVPNSAAIYLDGRPIGIADDYDGWPQKLAVEPGQHTLTFVEPGFAPEEVSVTVVPRHTARLRLSLEPLSQGSSDGWLPDSLRRPEGEQGSRYEPDEQGSSYEPAPSNPQAGRYGAGELRLSVTPSGASVSVDGERHGLTGAGPLVVSGLDFGSHEVSIEKPGYQRFVGDVSLPEGSTAVDLSVRLKPLDPAAGGTSQLRR